MQTLRFARALTAIVVLVAFNAAAIVWFVAAGGTMGATGFAVWFTGDLLIGLLALALTEPP
jgi:hypothetical protein